MDGLPELLVVGRAEIPTTVLGAACFRGASPQTAAAIRSGIDWSTEGTHPLHAALHGGHGSLALALLAAGSPIDDPSYAIAIDQVPAVLDALPSRPELVRELQAARALVAFHRALLDLDCGRARQLLAEHRLPIDQPLLLSHGLGAMTPLQLALHRGDRAAIQLVLAAGAAVNALSADGRSPLREVMENRRMASRSRRGAAALLRQRGGQALPAETLGERLKRALGMAW